MSEGVIPERITGETAKAHKGFVDYCEMGAGRSLLKLHRRYTERALEPVTLHLRTLKRWSTEHNWQARVAEYERRAAEQREQERQRQRIEIEQGVIVDGLRMLEWWDTRWQQFEQVPKGITTYDAREMGKLRREVDDLVRRSLGLPNTVTESTVKGTGKGGAVQVEHVTPISYVEVVPEDAE